MKNNIISSLVLCVLLSGCESEEDDKIYSAQMCINTADTGPEVDACLAKIAGITTPRSYVLRCAGDFIRAGITTPTIITAIENIDNNNSGNTTDPTLEFYQEFSFDSDDNGTIDASDLTDAETAVTNCTASGSSNLRILALSAQNATLLRFLAGGDLTTWFNTPVDPTTLSDTEIRAVGNNIIAMQSTACGKGGTFEGTEICDNINIAISTGGGDALTVGQAFVNQLQSAND